ncbi:MAG: hypothetical protein K9N36_09975 [Candidatus Marinimicrobia bacterium]|nr:hypothetical protein [Candidatus Neomarinimicrobiota bacterium]
MKKHKILLSGLLLVGLSAVNLTAAEPAVTAVGAPVALTAEADFFMSPVWSPAGDEIAVTKSNYYGIYLVSFPGGDVIQLADEPAVGFGMQWNHSGSHIAGRTALFENKRRYNALVTYDVTAGVREQLTDYATTMPGTPVWTANDDYLYLTGSDRFQLFPVNANRSQNLPTAGNAVYVMRDGIQYRNLASAETTAIQAIPGRVLNLTTSPDGSKLAFEIMGGHLWITDMDGSNPIDLGVGNHPVWHPDGSKLAFMIGTDDGHTYLTADIYVVNADGTGLTNLTNSGNSLEMNATWSPNGRYIAYDTMNSGQIFVQEVR